MRIQDEAKAIAEEFALEHTDVLRLLKKAGRFGPSYSAPEGDDGSLAWLLQPPSLAALCREIPPEDALAVFEESEPWLVRRRRELLMQFVPSSPYPFYTLKELVSIIDWLPRPTSQSQAESPDTCRPSEWLDSMVPGTQPEAGDGELAGSLLRYGKAVLFELACGLKWAKATPRRRWKERREVATQTWRKCLSLFAEHLGRRPALGERLRREIGILAAWDTETSQDGGALDGLRGGVLSPMFVALYVCKEIAIGTCDRTRAALGPLVGLDPLGRPTLKANALSPGGGCKALVRKKGVWFGNGGEIDVPGADLCFYRLTGTEDDYITLSVEELVRILREVSHASGTQSGILLSERALQEMLRATMRGPTGTRGGGLPPGPPDGAMLDGDWRWEDVTVMLDRDGETIGFDLPGCFSIRRHYAQLSFSNASIKTGAMLPIDCWDVFKEFLRSGRDECGRGRFRFHDEVAGDGSGERKVVETINTKLVGGTGSRDGNPIISVGPRSYRTRFKVQNLPDETIEAETDPLATPEDVADAQRCRDWVESKLRALGKPNPMIGASRALLPVYVGIRAIAERRDRLAPVLIYGAQGTGKELLMQLVHDISEATGRYVTFNATGIPDNMVESTLFGIVKGAATGVEASPGLFEEAAGGTLVLDCMEEASSGLQDKLLRAVDPTTRKYRPVGGGRDKDTECRVLMTFNQPLPLLIQRQKLRSDLPDRFEFQISLPPLDSRREDIPELVGHFALEYLHEEGLDRLVPQMEELFGIADFITFCESQNWSNREQDLNIRGLRKYVWQRLATRKRRLVDAGTISVPGARIEEMSASAFADLLRETIPNDATSHFRSSNKLGSLQKIIQVFGAASTVQGLVAGFGYDHSEHLMKALGRLKHEGLRNLLIRRFRALPG